MKLATLSWRIKYRMRRIKDALSTWARTSILRHQRGLRLLGWLAASLTIGFGLLALADPYVQAPLKTCSWGRSWFGCVLANHESLAGACFTLVAALIAWGAIQEQLAASVTDRRIARAKLSQELDWQAEAVGAALGVISSIGEDSPTEKVERTKEAVQYACTTIAKPVAINSYRQMIALLSWEERMYFEELLAHLEELTKINWDDAEWMYAAKGHFEEMSWAYEFLVPASGEYFKGIFRRTPKAMTTGDWVRRMAGEE